MASSTLSTTVVTYPCGHSHLYETSTSSSTSPVGTQIFNRTDRQEQPRQQLQPCCIHYEAATTSAAIAAAHHQQQQQRQLTSSSTTTTTTTTSNNPTHHRIGHRSHSPHHHHHNHHHHHIPSSIRPYHSHNHHCESKRFPREMCRGHSAPSTISWGAGSGGSSLRGSPRPAIMPASMSLPSMPVKRVTRTRKVYDGSNVYYDDEQPHHNHHYHHHGHGRDDFDDDFEWN